MADFKFTQTGQQIQNDLDLVENSIGDVFSTSSTYAVGDLVIYNNKLWKCHTAVSSAGDWTGTTNWTETQIANVLKATPSGGTTGQVLKKKSNTNYDTEWANESGGGGTQLYKHNILVKDTNNNDYVVFDITGYTTNNTPITSFSQFSSSISNMLIIGNLHKYSPVSPETYSLFGFFEIYDTIIQSVGSTLYKTGLMVTSAFSPNFDSTQSNMMTGKNFGDFDITHYSVEDIVTAL